MALVPPYPRPPPGSNVKTPRVYGAGRYGESLYGLWESGGGYTLILPCTPAWAPAGACAPAWTVQAPCTPAWAPAPICGG
jgi:hypothetical protein